MKNIIEIIFLAISPSPTFYIISNIVLFYILICFTIFLFHTYIMYILVFVLPDLHFTAGYIYSLYNRACDKYKS